MSNRLNKVLNNWHQGPEAGITVENLRQIVNRNTEQMKRELKDNNVKDAVLFDYTGAGDITLERV